MTKQLFALAATFWCLISLPMWLLAIGLVGIETVGILPFLRLNNSIQIVETALFYAPPIVCALCLAKQWFNSSNATRS